MNRRLHFLQFFGFVTVFESRQRNAKFNNLDAIIRLTAMLICPYGL
jgi:hypothetical protein